MDLFYLMIQATVDSLRLRLQNESVYRESNQTPLDGRGGSKQFSLELHQQCSWSDMFPKRRKTELPSN